VRPQHGHPHARTGNGDVGAMEDFAGLVDQFHLFFIIAVGADFGIVAVNVKGQLVFEGFDRYGFALEHLAGLLEQFQHGGLAGPAGRLIRADYHSPDGVGLVQGPNRHNGNNRRAIRVGNNALVLVNVLRIDFRHNQRHIRVHAEGGGIIDDDGSGFDSRGGKFPAAGTAG